MILIQPAPGANGQYVAHHLDLDLARLGDTPEDALKALEAPKTIEGIPNRAPAEAYEAFRAVLEHGKPADLSDLHDVWAMDGENVYGLNLKDAPGLLIPVWAADPTE